MGKLDDIEIQKKDPSMKELKGKECKNQNILAFKKFLKCDEDRNMGGMSFLAIFQPKNSEAAKANILSKINFYCKDSRKFFDNFERVFILERNSGREKHPNMSCTL